MSTLAQQIQETEARYHRCEEQRERRAAHVEQLRKGEGGDWREVDEPERVLSRLIALGQHDLAGEAMASTSTRQIRIQRESTAAPEVSVLERVLAENNLLGVTFLLKGALQSRAVGRVSIRRRGRVVGFGTGFLISPRLMMTNNHVLSSESSAAGSAIEFNFFEVEPGRPTAAVAFGLRPGELFITDRRLDFTVVAVEPRAGDQDLASRGWVPLIESSGKAVVGERVNIIQHPGGEPQQVAVHQNQIVDLVEDFLHYSTDTERGSSGSPVFNDQWDVAALHHSGVPKRRNGRIVLDDGTFWDGSDRDRERIAWVANEGVRISRIVAHVKRRLAGRPQQLGLFEQSFEPCGHDFENLRLLSMLEAVQDAPPADAAAGLSTLGPQLDDRGGATWVLPLTVRVDLPGALQPGTGRAGSPPERRPQEPSAAAPPDADPAAAGPDAEPIDEDALGSALASLDDHADQPYYEADRDAEDRAAYYPEDLPDLSPQDLFRRLGSLMEETHTTRLSYKTARLEHLYPWVDLRPDRQLKSIYSGQGFDPEEVIRLDLEVAAQREAILRERMAAERVMDPDAVQELLDDLESQMPFNCEHVVPQSWFGKAQPMKADLHHLFTCESPCNSFRSNTPYFDFPDEIEEAFRDACGRSEDGRTKFEPQEGKGPVARATLYFLLRYPGLIGDVARELQAERLDILLRWHRDFEVDDYERHRNAAIFAVQGNRNPLIDFPGWVDAIDFRLGFGVLGG